MTAETHVYPVSAELAQSAWIDNDKYLAMYEKSVADPDGFWAEEGKGMVLAGEVSAVNDDSKDNRFYQAIGRFPEIDEDEAPMHLLAWEYPKAS